MTKYIYEVNFNSSKLDFYSKEPSDGHWIYLPCYTNIYAVTCHKSTAATWYINQDTGQEGTFLYGGSISYCRIFMKNFPTTGSSYTFGQYVMRHEIGHVLGMGHTDQNSIMLSDWYPDLQIYNPLIYDKYVLHSFYPNP